MAASIHVKSNSKWKPVKLDPRIYTDKYFGGLLCVEELKDYEIVNDKKTALEVKDKAETPSTTKAKTKLKRKVKDDGTLPSQVIEKKAKIKVTQEKEKTHKLDAGQKTDDSKEAEKEAEKPVTKITRKKKKLLKWKEKERLKKEARRAHVVGKQQIISMTTDEVITEAVKNEGNTKQADGKKKKVKGNKQEKKKSPNEPPTTADKNINPKPHSKVTKDMSAWCGLYVPDPVLEALSDMEFTSPMPIQSLALPSAIRDSMDILGAAQTGSGKTLAFAIPVLHHILKHKERKSELRNQTIEEEEGDGNEDDHSSDDDEDDIKAEDSAFTERDDSAMEEETDEDSDDDVPDDTVDEIQDDFSGDEGYDNPPDDVFGDEGYDNPPDEEAAIDFDTDGPGLVKVLNNVDFDWLEEGITKPEVKASGELLCLVLTPTRELAVQVKNHIEAVAKYTDIKVGLIVGGMAPQKQKRLLKRCPEIVVATPGRLWELIAEGDNYLSNIEDVKYLVIDEADRMIEKGHFEELSILLEKINANEKKKNRRQTFVFSATLTVVHSTPTRYIKKKKVNLTLDAKLEKLMAKIGIKDRPKVIDLTGRVGTADSLTEAKIHCSTQEKDGYLYYLTRQYPGRTLVFANSKDCIRRLASIFTLLDKNPLTLHADMHQKQRLKNLEKFTADNKGLLLATDVAARGLDIPNVQHVIHYQVPRTTENYVHRSGRTARAYKEGLSVMLIGPEDLKNYKKIIYTLNKNEDLPMFPVEFQYYNVLRERVNLAIQIDSQEHRFSKMKHNNDWYQRAAKEADIELDEQIVLNDLGDQSKQADMRSRLKKMREELKILLKQPISSYSFSGKYPTKSGKLVLPKKSDIGEDAVACVKKDKAFQASVLKKTTKPKLKVLKQKRKWKKK